MIPPAAFVICLYHSRYYHTYSTGHTPCASSAHSCPLLTSEGVPMLPPLTQPLPVSSSAAGDLASEPHCPSTGLRKPRSSSTIALMVCNTGEALPSCLVQSLKDFFFVELHWFLSASLLPPSLCLDDPNYSHCHSPSSVCQFCCSLGHRSSVCLWGIDDPASLDLGSLHSGHDTLLSAHLHLMPIPRVLPLPLCLLLGHWSAECCRITPPLRRQPSIGSGEPHSRAKA